MGPAMGPQKQLQRLLHRNPGTDAELLDELALRYVCLAAPDAPPGNATQEVPRSTGGLGPEARLGHQERGHEQSRPELREAAYLQVLGDQLERPGHVGLLAFGSGTRHRSRATPATFAPACSNPLCLDPVIYLERLSA
ncbi:hypothetical protein MTO96_048726 [Rhipicephalus appendiculatus]